MSKPMRQCDECSEWFAPARVNARFCSKQCSTRFHVREHRARTGEAPHDPISRECVQCGDWFETRQENQQYCSKFCHDRAGLVALAQGQARRLAKYGKSRSHGATPREAYEYAKADAERRNQSWELSYEDWWRAWSPYWDNREGYELYRLDLRAGFRHGNVVVMTEEVANVYYEEPHRT